MEYQESPPSSSAQSGSSPQALGNRKGPVAADNFHIDLSNNKQDFFIYVDPLYVAPFDICIQFLTLNNVPFFGIFKHFDIIKSLVEILVTPLLRASFPNLFLSHLMKYEGS